MSSSVFVDIAPRVGISNEITLFAIKGKTQKRKKLLVFTNKNSNQIGHCLRQQGPSPPASQSSMSGVKKKICHWGKCFYQQWDAWCQSRINSNLATGDSMPNQFNIRNRTKWNRQYYKWHILTYPLENPFKKSWRIRHVKYKEIWLELK